MSAACGLVWPHPQNQPTPGEAFDMMVAAEPDAVDEIDRLWRSLPWVFWEKPEDALLFLLPFGRPDRVEPDAAPPG